MVTKSKVIQLHDKSFEEFITAEQLQKRVDEIGEVLSRRFEGKCPVFISILKGSFIFTADLMRATNIPCEVAFTQLSSYDGLGSTGTVQTKLNLDVTLKNRHVIIAEDIIDTGNTMKHFLLELQKYNPASVHLVTLLLKPEALQHALDIEYVGFEIPNKFVVGYGLDYNEHGRNLKGIYQLKE